MNSILVQEQTHEKSPKHKGSIKEGVARAISQALTYIFEVRKTSIQIYGRTPNWTPLQWTSYVSKGILQSSLSSGLVFHSYFTIYHALSDTRFASLAAPLASFLTSGLKIPFGNCMRIVQSTPTTAPTIIHASLVITKNRGINGLYSGYILSLFEDIIEMDVRIRLYDFGKRCVSQIEEANLLRNPRMCDECVKCKMRVRMSQSENENEKGKKEVVSHSIVGFALGGLSGAVAGALTTPFDTLRSHMAFQTFHSKIKRTGVQILADISKEHGICAVYRGMHLRAISVGFKAALFCSVFEALSTTKRET